MSLRYLLTSRFFSFIPPSLLWLFPAFLKQYHVHDAKYQESDKEKDIFPSIVPLQDLVPFYTRKYKAGNSKHDSKNSPVWHVKQICCTMMY